MSMNFSQIADLPYIDFLQRKRAEAQGKLIVYLHVPKAAGNSSIGLIKKHVSKFKSIQWNDIDKSWENFIEEHLKDPFDLVSGHFRDKHIDLLIDAGIEFFTVSFIRHPIDRIVSQYKYMCTPAHPDYIEFKKQYPTFESFISRNVGDNVMSRILVRGAFSLPNYLRKLDSKYGFIGLTEFYHLSMSILLDIIEGQYKLEPRRNVTRSNKDNSFELKHSTYLDLARSQSLDIEMFNFYHNLYATASEHYLEYKVSN